MMSSEVVIVGAGPVGLSLALDLARRGRRVLVLEKNPTTAEHSRAPAIWPRTQEILAELGVIDDFLSEGIVVRRLQLHDVDRGRTLLTAPLEELANRTRYPHLLVLPQSRTEQLLLNVVQRQASAEVRFCCEVFEVVEENSGVRVGFHTPEGDAAVACQLVAGCDGAHSIVREQIGASFDGITYQMQAALADVRIEGSRELPFPRLTSKPRIAIGIRIGEDLWRMILPFRENSQTLLQQRVEDAADSLFPGRSWEPVWQSEFRLHRRLSSTFAEGRIVLAGDAAHLNSPVGGQGMNAGIQDTALLTPSILASLEDGDSTPLHEYGIHRRREISTGVNRFTDTLTKLLLSGRGRLFRTVFRVANAAMWFGPVRRRILRRLAMLE